jgi:hypothetical protein
MPFRNEHAPTAHRAECGSDVDGPNPRVDVWFGRDQVVGLTVDDRQRRAGAGDASQKVGTRGDQAPIVMVQWQPFRVPVARSRDDP